MEELIAVAACLTLNALFAAYEMAFVSVPRPELRRLARDSADARRLLALRENPERTLSVIQVGITLVGAVSAAVGGAGAIETVAPWIRARAGISDNAAAILAILAVVLPLTYVSVVIGELVPKSLALKNPVRIALWGARPLEIADHVLSPAVTALEWSTRQALRVFFPRSRAAHEAPETSVEIGELQRHHQQAVLNLAHIERRRIRDILIPWREVNFVRSSDAMEEVALVIFASGHTRLPVVSEGSRVEGILHTKELLALREAGARDWTSIVRPALKALPGDSVLSMLRIMQARRNHMAVVVSSAGDAQGLITLEDISEEIWGEIFDEDDDSRIRQIFADRVKTRRFKPRSA